MSRCFPRTASGQARPATPSRSTPPAAPVQATLEWDPNSEPDLAGYKLHYGLASGSYTSVVDVGNQTSYILTGLTAGTTYYISRHGVQHLRYGEHLLQRGSLHRFALTA